MREEFAAQLERFVALVGHAPANVNAHHHLHVFRPVGDALREVLARVVPRPYLRRVVEPRRTLTRVPGRGRSGSPWTGSADARPGDNQLTASRAATP